MIHVQKEWGCFNNFDSSFHGHHYQGNYGDTSKDIDIQQDLHTSILPVVLHVNMDNL